MPFLIILNYFTSYPYNKIANSNPSFLSSFLFHLSSFSFSRLHAVDSKGDSVGTFDFPSNSENAKFHNPHNYCPHAALHTSAELKPLLSKFSFSSPPEGTGDITFRSLIKTGPANDGAFYYPSVDITLKEGEVKQFGQGDRVDNNDLPVTWIKSDEHESCKTTCENSNQFCNLKAMRELNTNSLFSGTIDSIFSGVCQLPYLTDCSPVSPVMSSTGKCYYHDSNAAHCGTQDKNGTSHVSRDVSCEARGLGDVNSVRLCACSDDKESTRKLNAEYSDDKENGKPRVFAVGAILGLVGIIFVLSNKKHTKEAKTANFTPISTSSAPSAFNFKSVSSTTLCLAIMLSLVSQHNVIAHNWVSNSS